MQQIEKLNKILIPSIPDHYYKTNEDQPQRVTSIEPYTVKCFLDSEACSSPNKVNIDLTTIRFPGETANFMIDQTKTFFISNYSINWITPNVNKTNNNIRVYSSAVDADFSVNVVEGFYATSTDLITAIITALNTVSAFSQLTFQYFELAGFPDMYDVVSTGGDYYILNDCTGSKFGKFLWNLPQDEVPTSFKYFGQMNLQYTRYIDFSSRTLTRYITNTSTGNQINKNVILKVWIDNPQKHSAQTREIPKLLAANTRYRYDTSVSNCDIQIRDEFGNFLYLPLENGTSSFWWSIGLVLE